ncbi:MAG: zinc-binding dehydrogenase [Micromonosporaceae bacterium]|nr:zinc-binding dehydrogenase [Micromonosporaceae bacterium]
MTLTARQVQVVSRPDGWPESGDFQLVEVAVPELSDGQLLVRNQFISVDPYMRGKLNDVRSYTPPYQLNAPMDGGAVGEVVASRSPERAVGDVVVHQAGWRDLAVLDAARTRRVDVTEAPASAYLGVLGGTGFTAWVGLTEIAPVRPGETVFVSAAAGAVGSIAGQVARLRGAAQVVGSAGTPAKLARLRELGFDAGFDYHDRPVRERLREAAPDGIDVYFDNVGGEQLEAAIAALKPFGRVALCGAISVYNATAAEPPPGPRNLALAVGKQLTLRGFIVTSYGHLRERFDAEMAGWLRTGQVHYDETVVDGLEHAVDAFLGLLRGENTGKMLVRTAVGTATA